MGVEKEMLSNLRKQIKAGFQISEHSFEKGIHSFILPALECPGDYIISVPTGSEVQAFIASEEFQHALMKPIKIGVAVLDLVGFSQNPDEVQLKMIVRYQCEIRKVIEQFPVERKIAVGDGVILVFKEPNISAMAECIWKIDHEVAGFNLDFKGDNIPEINHRIGVHVGPAYFFRDINEEPNYIGTGVNIAQRVSSCVPTGKDKTVSFFRNSTVYLSKDAAEEFKKFQLPEGIKFFDAGIQEVKHGVKIHVFAMQKETREEMVVKVASKK